MTRRRWWSPVLWGIAILALAVVVLQYIPSGEVEIAPGITGNLRTMVHVSHGHRPGPGRLLMVAIDVGPVSELQYLLGQLNPTVEFQPATQVLGPLNMNQYVQYNDALMQQSQWSAEVAGERLAGLNARVITVPGAVVLGLVPHSAAKGKIQPGALITRIGPYAVSSVNAVRAIMHHFHVGETVPVTVVQNGHTRVVSVRTTRIKGDPDPAIGVYISALQKPVIPRHVVIHAGQIGGPSAGMMFALEIYDQITGHNIAHGQIVAGTGEILPNGQVVEIGGVAQKVVTVYRAGARVFVVPKANYPKARAMAQRMGYHMKIFPVTNVRQALSDIESATSSSG
ncbi:MAG: signal protein PDZ [Firmicutes bacterium]|nr:signal protein PDZ [Bacillota bacterium]